MTYVEKRPDGTVRVTGGAGITPLDIYPVGSLYFSTSSANPATYFGGSWARYANGRMLVGVNESDPSFASPGVTGGEKEVTLTVNQIPAHDHSISHDHSNATTNTSGNHNHTADRGTSTGSSPNTAAQGNTTEPTAGDTTTSTSGAHEHTVNIPSYSGTSGSRGGNQAHNNLPPYIAVYIWRRTG